ncbi:tRNA (adenine(22)-N(1))-methyltransferase [Endozoicomonas sp.]|uniref:tRNA (adenine(22)-N(1))-methyltransferase n=1 Tax=Endozoicomonas sp. TaxID=1892382 RepID=UPI002883EC6E|nr:tRNA (adenine(22)-N(1))-methyltransferase TrmK [Endozoicomonas sp.]
MKLSKRLKQIESMVAPEYSHIWDCCCDHGLLGAALLSRQAAQCIHFVDIVPELMAELESKLAHFFSHSSSARETHCLDVKALPLDQYEGKHLIIIAGVGGDLMVEFINAIVQEYPAHSVDFLLCPVYHQFMVRQQLIELDFSLRNEVLVEENRRFYEILLVSSVGDEPSKISPFGDSIWKVNTVEQARTAKRYLSKTLNHYQRIQSGDVSSVQPVIDGYQSVTISGG